MRFAIRIDPVWRAFLLAGGATRRNSFVELTDTEITFRFGALFRRTFPRADIDGAAGRRWPLWYGVGWRSNLRGVIGLIGSYRDVVEVKLKARTRAWGVFPCDRIAVSLEDPNGFLSALGDGARTSRAETPRRASGNTNSGRRSTRSRKA